MWWIMITLLAPSSPLKLLSHFHKGTKKQECVYQCTRVCMGVCVNVCTEELERENVHSVCVM